MGRRAASRSLLTAASAAGSNAGCRQAAGCSGLGGAHASASAVSSKQGHTLVVDLGVTAGVSGELVCKP